MRKQSVGDAKNWRSRSPTSPRTGFGSAEVGVQPSRKKAPAVLTALEALVAPETAGDPMRPCKWIRSSLRTLSGRLKDAGHSLSPPTVGRLLRKLDYSLHVNSKQLEARSNHPDRDAQFAHIADQCALFTAAGQPIISVDTKKKELIGDFKQAGRSWSRAPIPVNIHDFLQDSQGRAVPYGIYDVLNNRGTVYVGTSADTPAFAVDAIAGWWLEQGRAGFPDAHQLLILADAGGSNSARARLWKERLQAVVCDRLRLQVTVCHYPTGCSKWNPIEHRSVQLHQRQLCRDPTPLLGSVPGGHPRHHYQGRLDGRRRAPFRQSISPAGPSPTHSCALSTSNPSLLSSLELLPPSPATSLIHNLNSGTCSFTLTKLDFRTLRDAKGLARHGPGGNREHVAATTLPPTIVSSLLPFAPMFSRRVWAHVQVLLAGILLSPARRTVAAARRVLGLAQLKQFHRYHRVLSQARWSGLAISRILLNLLVTAFAADGPLILGVDETLERRRGARIAAKGIYHDAVRSSHSHFVKASGLRWICLMLLVPIPWAARTWALPVLTALAHPSATRPAGGGGIRP